MPSRPMKYLQGGKCMEVDVLEEERTQQEVEPRNQGLHNPGWCGSPNGLLYGVEPVQELLKRVLDGRVRVQLLHR